MDSLQQSELWSFFAQLTKLFDWPAIGSVLVFLTLLQAIWLGGTASRRFEAQQSVTLGYVRNLLVRLSVVQKITDGIHDISVIQNDVLALVDDLKSEFDRIDPLALPTSACLEAIYQSKNAIDTLKLVYGPDDEHRSLFVAMLPSSGEHTKYSIEVLEREIEDRLPSTFHRLLRRFSRGRPLKRPESFLAKAASDHKA